MYSEDIFSVQLSQAF